MTELVKIPGTQVEMAPWPHGRHERAQESFPYVFDQELVSRVAIGVKLGMNVALTGPKGCGKTSLPIALAAFLGRPIVRFNMDGETRVSHLRGMQKPVASEGVLTLRFSPGDLVQAMTEGWWVVFDELDAAHPSVAFVLQPVLEEGNRRLHVPETGETVVASPEFRVFASGNTLGYRASSRANHAGTYLMNAALLDRFGMILDVSYPDKETEVRRVATHCPDAQKMIVDGICRVASEVRQDQKFKSDFSTRSCIQWARITTMLISQGEGPSSVLRAAELSVLNKLADPQDVEVIKQVILRIFKFPSWV